MGSRHLDPSAECVPDRDGLKAWVRREHVSAWKRSSATSRKEQWSLDPSPASRKSEAIDKKDVSPKTNLGSRKKAVMSPPQPSTSSSSSCSSSSSMLAKKQQQPPRRRSDTSLKSPTKGKMPRGDPYHHQPQKLSSSSSATSTKRNSI
uniref:Uncharacterized protein n=1 Tax=Rhizochromulina marina TaxID=1034831 RepID=A0A6U0X251_9STRA